MEIRKTFLKKDYHFVCESHKAWHGFQSNFSDFPVFAFCDDRNDSSRTFDVETSLGPAKQNKETQSEPFIKLLLTLKLKSVYLSTVFFLLTSQCVDNYKYVYIFTYNTYNTLFCRCIISLFSFLTFT